MALDSPPAIIVIDKEGDISDCPSIATMPAETQAYMKNHQLREYKVQRYEISPDGNTEYTLSLRAINPQDLINFMPDLESKSESQLRLLMTRVLREMNEEKVPLVMDDFRERVIIEIRNSQLIHREQRPALSRAILSNTLEIFDQDGCTPILPGTLLKSGKVSVIDITRLDQNSRRSVVLYIQLMLDKFKMQSSGKTVPVLTIIDEAEEYFGQTNSRTEKLFVNRILSKMEDVVNRGRKHLLGVVLVTHAPSALSKMVVNLTNIKVAFGLSGDQKWISEFFGKNNVSEIQQLPTGKARITAKISTANNDQLNVKIRIPFVGDKNDLPKDDAS